MPTKNKVLRERIDFSKIPATIQIPDLIEVQKRSYDRFLQMDKLPAEREDMGLESVFKSVFPIADFRNVSQLDFVDFSIGNWSASAVTSRASITSVPPVRAAATRSSPIRSIRAKCSAASAAATTPIRPASAPNAAIPWACN